ncbi:MAG: DedA family protein [Sphingobacteriales bacterium]|nr:DedA family protein [Sphingobacteriales bacterium]
MKYIQQFIDFILHLDTYLEAIMQEYQLLTYAILCLIIFCETGLVITPFLPGDSLLFAAGAIVAKTGILNVWLLIALLIAAAFLGDNVNYFFGRTLGERVFKKDYWFLKKKYLIDTQKFYEKHGGTTIILARFVPIIRTFAPFVAGVGKMSYGKYITYCILGATLWVTGLTSAGYFFGGIPFVKENFEIVVLGIVATSLIPVIIQAGRKLLSKK